MPRSRIYYVDGDMRTYKIAAVGGDGIGPEVVQAGVQVLKVCAERDGRFTLDFQDFGWGSDYYRTHGVMMPADGADQLPKFDAILFGAVGSPDIPDHITLWGLRLAICQRLDQYARWCHVNLSRSKKPEAGCAITLPPLHSAIRSPLRLERSAELIVRRDGVEG